MSWTFPWASLFGGILLGISATLLLLLNGKIAGISGIFSGLLTPKRHDFLWRLLFTLGLIGGGWLAATYGEFTVPHQLDHSAVYIVLAGLLVGIGTRVGNGCTSGHGICGIGRLSPRSIIATCVFMMVAGVVVFVRLHLI